MTDAATFFARHGVTVERVMTDNARNCRTSRVFQDTLESLGITHKRNRNYHPQTNGKVCEHDGGAARSRSDPGQGMTNVSFARFVDWFPCCATARAGQTELT